MDIPPASVVALAVPFSGSHGPLYSYIPTLWGPYLMSHKTIQLPPRYPGCENVCKEN